MKWTNAFRRAGAVLAVVFLTGTCVQIAVAQQTPPAEPPAQDTPADPTESAPMTPIEIPARPAIIVRGNSKWDDGFKNITDAFSKLRAEAGKLQLSVNGKPLAVFVQSDDEGFTFEAMMPVDIDPASAPKLSDGITAGRSPGGTALKFEHRGAYDDIESTYEAIAAYLDEKGLAARDELIEEFVNETVGSDDTNIAVDIYVLLKQ